MCTRFALFKVIINYSCPLLQTCNRSFWIHVSYLFNCNIGETSLGTCQISGLSELFSTWMEIQNFSTTAMKTINSFNSP